jgi:hypothetical protein
MYKRDASQVVTYEPDGSDQRYLGAVGGVSGLQYSYVLPGGPDQLQCTLLTEPGARVRALEPGRITKVFRGVSCVWDGKLDQPTPSDTGWAVNAHGIGAPSAADFMSYYTGSWGSGTPDTVVNNAIGRGLRWVNPGISGMGVSPYMGTQQDPASQTVADFLSSICDPANLTWMINPGSAGCGNVLSLFTPQFGGPANCLLITSLPAARTLFGYFTDLFLRYQATADNKTSGAGATYATTSYHNTAQSVQHGPLELYADLSAVGVQSAAAAQAVGQKLMSRYQAANFAGPFTVSPNQLCNLGGVAIDLGLGMQGPLMAQVLVANDSYGGEVTTSTPLIFLVGSYIFYDDSQSAQISPFQYQGDSLSSLLSNWTTIHTPVTTTTGGKSKG